MAPGLSKRSGRHLPLAAGRKFGCGAALHPRTPKYHKPQMVGTFECQPSSPGHPRVSRRNFTSLLSTSDHRYLRHDFADYMPANGNLAMISAISCPQAVKIAFWARYQQKRGRNMICGHKSVIFMAGPMPLYLWILLTQACSYATLK